MTGKDLQEMHEKFMFLNFKEEFRHYDTFACETGEVVDVWMRRFGMGGCMATEIRWAVSKDGGEQFFVFAHGVPLTNEEKRMAEEIPEMVRWDRPFRAGSLWEAIGIAFIIERMFYHAPPFESAALEYALSRLQDKEEK